MKPIFFICLFFIVAIIVSCSSTKFAEIVAVLPDLSDKPDGVYRGFYDLSGSPVKVTLDVIVLDKKITEIKIVKHFRSPIGKKAEKITEKIIAEQSLAIDAISGATGSSKAILKAVENALE